ncbi:MAG: single-stranded DNA-binding protein [Oscillochloridaceae bacterium umkhey_bin13]
MARDLNKVMLIGRLGVDPELRYTSSGTPVTSFRLAVGRQWRDSQGESRDETEWFSVVAWNKLAKVCQQDLVKGMRVYIEGRLQTRAWDDQQSGQTRYKTEVIANDLIILEGREQRPPHEPDTAQPPRDLPRPSRSVPPPQRDIGDEDIPF